MKYFFAFLSFWASLSEAQINQIQQLSPALTEPSATIPIQPTTDPSQNLTTSVVSEKPSDFQLIGIKPYYKNKSPIAKMNFKLILSESEKILATLSKSIGDCQDCFRGATLKSKIGIRIYGDQLSNLTLTRKHSASIKLNACADKTQFVNQLYICEFESENIKYKLVIQIEP